MDKKLDRKIANVPLLRVLYMYYLYSMKTNTEVKTQLMLQNCAGVVVVAFFMKPETC